jgi:phospholipase/lecithinase/hemolysin
MKYRVFFPQAFSHLQRALVLSALPVTLVTGMPQAVFSASLSAQKFEEIYVFGDSLSDVGNVFNVALAVTEEGFPPPPYFQGRFSNGPVWVDYLAQDLGLAPTPYIDVAGGAVPTDGINYAFGGATTGSSNSTIAGLLPGLQQQIDNYTAANTSADPDALYVVWAGANDYLGDGVTDVTEPVNNLSTAVTSLYNVGARDIMVVNLPDLGKLPGTRGDSQISSRLNALTSAHNSSLAATLDLLSQKPEINIIPVDVNSIFNRAIADPGEFGFTNVTGSCLTESSVCANPDEYLFWDDIHPTTAAHELVGELAFSALEPEPIPEPSAELGLLALGALGAVSVLKRKQKKAS